MSAARSESSLLRRPFDICARAFAASVRRKYGVGRNVSGDFAYRTDFGVRPDFFKKAYREPARKLLRHIRQGVQRPRHVHGIVHVPVEVDIAYARVARYGVRRLRRRRFGALRKVLRICAPAGDSREVPDSVHAREPPAAEVEEQPLRTRGK
jgi:hypothetical protein